MQDFTGVPAIVDLATMRDMIKKMGGDPKKINPLQQVDLVIDHSVQVDQFGTPAAFAFNADRELERNRERYIFLKWGQKAFQNCRVVPPDVGIVHQVNLEYIAPAVFVESKNGRKIAYPDTLVGTDSHTTMINGLGVVGWGVGGIEAEGAMLGQPLSMLIPAVVGFKLSRPNARRHDSDGRRAYCYSDAESERCRRQICRILWQPESRASVWRIARRSPTWRRNTAPRSDSSRSMRRR